MSDEQAADDPFTYSYCLSDIEEMFRRAARLKAGLPADEDAQEDVSDE